LKVIESGGAIKTSSNRRHNKIGLVKIGSYNQQKGIKLWQVLSLWFFDKVLFQVAEKFYFAAAL
jgi:hypothetical protein